MVLLTGCHTSDGNGSASNLDWWLVRDQLGAGEIQTDYITAAVLMEEM
jgi:hypothetical protein